MHFFSWQTAPGSYDEVFGPDPFCINFILSTHKLVGPNVLFALSTSDFASLAFVLVSDILIRQRADCIGLSFRI